MKKDFLYKNRVVNFGVTLALAKLGTLGPRLLSNVILFSDDIPVEFSELSIGVQNQKF